MCTRRDPGRWLEDEWNKRNFFQKFCTTRHRDEAYPAYTAIFRRVFPKLEHLYFLHLEADMHKGVCDCDVDHWPVDAEGNPLPPICENGPRVFWTEVVSEVLKTSRKLAPLRNIQTIYFSPEMDFGGKFAITAAKLLKQEYKGLERYLVLVIP